LNLYELLGCEPYVSGNVGSGIVEELAKWVEYMTSDNDSPTVFIGISIETNCSKLPAGQAITITTGQMS
jgi:hypothetical protein